MGISKVILNGVVKVDLTQDTVDETNLLAGETATGADGEAVEGAIASKSSTDLTVSGATVTAPAGFYSAAASKSVATTTHPNPTASINSTTGVVTASHTQGTGYVTGGTTTGTLNLTTQAGKTVTPTETEQTAVAAGRYTTGAVTVGAISSTYVGSGITQRDSDDLTASGAKVTAPAGYYAEAASKSVATTTHPAPTASINSSTGLVTASHTQGTGYVTGGTTTGTLQITAQAAKTVTPTESEQTAVAAGRYTTGIVKVGAISSTYVGSDITQRDSDDLTASGATISVPAGYYAEAASKAVASGTAGTPSASKGTVSNHSVSVTPSVTFTAGYITGGMKTGTAVTVNVAELESGTKSITENGTGISASGYSTVDVDVPGQIPTGTKYIYTDVDGTDAWDVSGYQYCSVDYAPVKDGTMRIWFDVADEETVNFVCTSNGYTIAWGDGTQETASDNNVTHTYATAGVYVAEVTNFGSKYLHQYAFGQNATNPNTNAIAIETPYGSYYGSYGFSGTSYCTNLKRATIHTPIASLRNNAFRGCTSLVLTSLPSGLTSIGNYAFDGCTSLALTSLPSGLTSIGSYAFQYCTSLALTSLPSGLTSIGAYAFRDCPSLALTSLPSGVTSIGNYAFQNCASLALTSLPSGVTSIAEYAFRDCPSLALTSLPSGVTSIGNYAFQNCASLSLTSLPSGVTSIGTYIFYGCTSLALTSLPSGVTSIAEYAFYDCKNLALTALPSGLTSLGSNTFHNCQEMALTSLPEGVTSIPAYCFRNCSSISSMTIPSTVTSIGGSSFCFVNGVRPKTTQTFTILATNPPTLGSSVFNKNTLNKIYVPAASLDAYKTATNWSSYASYMEAIA